MSKGGRPPTDDPPDYEVGYKRPPVHSRFKPGESGNPSGRKKRMAEGRDVPRQLQEVFMREVTVREGDKARSVPRIVALIERTVADAINGDPKAKALAYRMAEAFGVLRIKDTHTIDVTKLTPEEREICSQATEILRKARIVIPYES